MTTYSPQQRFLLGALFFGHLSNDWVFGTLWLIAPAIAASMGLGSSEVGLILALNGLGAALAYLPAGMITDRSSRPGYLMLLTFWWVAIGYLSATLVSGFWMITLLLAFGAMGDAFWHPVATGVLMKELPQRRAHALGVHAVGGSIGAEVLAPLATGFLLGHFDWQTSLQILILPVVIMGLIFIPVSRTISANLQSSGSSIDLKALLRHWASGSGSMLLLMIILYNMSITAMLGMTPLYLQSEHNLSPFHAGLIFAVLLVVGTVMQPTLGHYSDRMGRKPMIFGILLVSGICALIAGLSNTLAWVLVGLLPAVALLTAVRPPILAATVDFSEKSEATTLGIVFTVLDGVGMLGALFGGMIGEFDLAWAYLLASALAFLSAIICFVMWFPRLWSR